MAAIKRIEKYLMNLPQQHESSFSYIKKKIASFDHFVLQIDEQYKLVEKLEVQKKEISVLLGGVSHANSLTNMIFCIVVKIDSAEKKILRLQEICDCIDSYLAKQFPNCFLIDERVELTFEIPSTEELKKEMIPLMRIIYGNKKHVTDVVLFNYLMDYENWNPMCKIIKFLEEQTNSPLIPELRKILKIPDFADLKTYVLTTQLIINWKY